MTGKIVPSIVGLFAFLSLGLSCADVALASYAIYHLQDHERNGSFWPPTQDSDSVYATVPDYPTWLVVPRVNQTILVSAAFGIIAGFCCLVATGPLLTSAIRKPTRTVWPMICLVTSSIAMVITVAMLAYVFVEHYNSLQLPALNADLPTYLSQLHSDQVGFGRDNHMTAEAYLCQLAPGFDEIFAAGDRINNNYWANNCKTLKAARWIMLPNLICLVLLTLASAWLVFRCFVARRRQGTNIASKEVYNGSVSTA